MIVAAEASSALFAERLLQHWQKNGPQVSAFGVGTKSMEALGFERLGKSEEMAVMGAAEIISHYGLLRGVFNRLVEEAAKRRPNVVILMDYPEFNLMLAKKLHALGIRCVYYVSPQVWAWRKGRVKTIKKYCDKVFLLFPFEKPFYQEHNVPHEFIGHPLLDEISPELHDPEWQKQRRRRLGLQDDEIVVGLMPGSRRLELKNLFPIQLEVARRLIHKNPKIRIAILAAPTIEKEQLEAYLEDVRYPYMILKDEPFRMIAVTDYILATSGTATLMVGLMEKPMVIMYKFAPLTALFGRLVVRHKFFGLPNLILDKMVVPELLQGDVNPDRVYAEISRYLDDSAHDKSVRAQLAQLMTMLGDRGATKRVAAALEKYFRA